MLRLGRQPHCTPKDKHRKGRICPYFETDSVKPTKEGLGARSASVLVIVQIRAQGPSKRHFVIAVCLSKHLVTTTTTATAAESTRDPSTQLYFLDDRTRDVVMFARIYPHLPAFTRSHRRLDGRRKARPARRTTGGLFCI